MDKIKKYAKMMIDEISSADKYADMAIKLKADDKSLAEKYNEMAKQELHHKDVLAETVRHYIDECEEDKGEKCEDMETVFEFVEVIMSDMSAPILTKISVLD